MSLSDPIDAHVHSVPNTTSSNHGNGPILAHTWLAAPTAETSGGSRDRTEEAIASDEDDSDDARSERPRLGQAQDEEEDEDHRARYLCGVDAYYGGTRLIPNEGSTARDYLARERNFLSWIKLSSVLSIISAAILLHLSLGGVKEVPQFALNAAVPLSILFFIAAFSSLFVGIHDTLSVDDKYRRRTGFVYAGRASTLTTWAICGLALASCIILVISGFGDS
ncbi:BZ3500_MvSof-1268-A1-R1_Chr6-2g08452 [Microbotryum saponariae]|uniref:BZ3500_MvSof-1268-A1-R1_Chr6-2g08452 protein n=1 Tax=Microbotryum saponariae TaxID=289078 RepID=A0A2X0LP24_9BASI|nr:BZ3500_MvSof-1268-A1-R1_Chr6-2g08452 [Microbotryum saponariae]SDA07729.1 BZ3501_MvSof-1269-A2-R1_Chr6-1g08166 [Microbotryum saponariae]